MGWLDRLHGIPWFDVKTTRQRVAELLAKH